ncbi:lipocalin [Alginatibacterium sediminis]|uniref:Outer membrane lipoprotein Blc n=1 Tax=Alginatibacterium sediminis TaxID=2164068 RepID=A0A420E6F2_9ALTE|nr:lipocalin family protein [Alginatibacterium sediminis]RKF13260.1 lipocalin [Alginatibacterium sediminis]
MRIKMLTIVSFLCFGLSACVKLPQGIEPVTNFEVNKYLGQWYEVARLDHSFERDLEFVTANYLATTNDCLTVINRGYRAEQDEWKQARGHACFVEESDLGYLKVSFFGPFYGSYVIFELEQEDYSYAFVSGPGRDYLWFLSRSPNVSEQQKQHFLDVASDKGFAIEDIIWVKQQ